MPPDPTEHLRDLLGRIAGASLQPDEIRLAPILAAYRQRCEQGEPPELEDVGDYVALAARLLLLKSSRLLALPSDETADAPAGARDIWLQPQSLAALAADVRAREGRESVARSVLVAEIEPRIAARPPSLLVRTWREMAARAVETTVPIHVPAFVRLESAVSSLIRQLRVSARLPFTRLIGGGGRTEVVVQFLAALELVRRRVARVEQPELFGEMTIEFQEEQSDRATRAG